MSTQTATQAGAVKITLHSANNDVDEKAEVTVALKHPEEAVAKMLRTLAQRFPPESVMTIQPTAAPSVSRADYFNSSAVASGENLIHGTTSNTVNKNRDDSPLTQASSANGSRRNTPSRSKESGPQISPMGYNYPPNPVYSTSQDSAHRKGSQRAGRHGADDSAMAVPPSPTHMENAAGLPMFPGMPFGPGGMFGQGGMGMPNAAEAYAHGQMGGWPMMPPPQMFPSFGYPMMPPMPGSPMMDASGKVISGVWPYPGPPMPPYGVVHPGMIVPQAGAGAFGTEGTAAGQGQYVVDGENRTSAGIERSGVEVAGEVVPTQITGLPRGSTPPTNQYPSGTGQYPNAVGGQFPSTAGRYPAGAGQYPGGASGQYPSGAAGQYPGGATGQYVNNASGSQASHNQQSGFPARGRSSEVNRSQEYDPRYDISRPSGPQGTTDILNTLQPGFGEYCYVAPDGSRTRYVEVEVVEEREVRVPKVEVREVTREEKEVNYETVVREVEEVEYVDEVIETEKVIEQEREIKVPVKKIKEVPVERVVTKTVDIIDERVEIIEKPEVIEVEKFYTVEQPQLVPRYNQKEVPCMVAQKLRPSVRTEGKMKVATTTYEPVLYAVEVYIPKPVPHAIIPNGKINETHQRVDIPAAQYNSLVHRLNMNLDKQVVNEVCLKTVEGHVPLLPAGELADIIPPIPGAWADDRAIQIRERGAHQTGAYITKEKKHKKSHRKHRHHRN